MSGADDMRTLGWLAALNVLGAAVSVLNTVPIAHFVGTGRAVEICLAAIGLHTSVTTSLRPPKHITRYASPMGNGGCGLDGVVRGTA